MKDVLYSEYFKIKSSDLKKYDVFNGFENKDSNYYIIPHELENIKISEFKNSYEKFKKYFSDIIILLDNSSGNDIFYRKAEAKLQLHEIGNIGLGYSKEGKSGSGIGKKFAKQLAYSGYKLVKAGIKNPEIFQLVGLLEKGIGADRISDMTVSILQDDFFCYTQNTANKLKLPTKTFAVNSKTYELPYNKNDETIIFCPRSILTDLPIAFDYTDVENICSHNDALREKTNEIIGQVFDKKTRVLIKERLKALFLSNPAIVDKTIDEYKNKGVLYDFNNDPNGDFIWKEIANDTIKQYPLNIEHTKRPIEIVKIICDKYGDLIEHNGLWKFFHNNDGSHKNENFAQMLFYAIAFSYCEANNLDISPETNSGNGPIDFKIGKGFNEKINIETKLSTNPRLLHGYTSQLAIYNKAEKTNQSIFLIIQLYDKNEKRIKAVFDYRKRNENQENKLPEIIVIDATLRKSASKR